MRSQFYSTDLKRRKRLEENPEKLRDGLDEKKTFSTGRGGYYFFLAFLERRESANFIRAMEIFPTIGQIHDCTATPKN
jgi:hypothetical protein